MRRFTQSILRYTQAAMSNLQTVWRWTRSLFGAQTQWYEVLLLLIGIMGSIATQLDMIREFFPVHTLIKLDSWIGTAFGVVSASFIYKAWWYLQNSGDNEDKLKDGALSATVGILFLLIAVSFGVDLPFTG